MSMPFSDLPEIVQIGQRVIVELIDQEGRREQLALDVVPDDAADFASGFLGAGTPLAQAILGSSRRPYPELLAGMFVRVRDALLLRRPRPDFSSALH